MWVIGGIFILVALLSIIGSQIDDSPEAQLARIKKSCEQEYGPDTYESRNCQIAIVAAQLQKQETDRFRRAADGAGL